MRARRRAGAVTVRDETPFEPLSDSEIATFVAPRWSDPFDVDAFLDELPPEATVRGFFFIGLHQHAKKHGLRLVERGPYYAFKGYPTAEFVSFVHQLAEELHGDLEPREALRRVGALSQLVLEETPVGGPVFGGFGTDVHRILSMLPTIREYCVSPGTITVRKVGERSTLIGFRDFHVMLEHFFVGAVELMISRRGLTPDVRCRLHSPFDADFLVRW